MHCIDDKANGIIVNFNSDWSGEVRIAWYDTREQREPRPSLRECWCDGRDLIAGLFTPVRVTSEPPPGAVVVTEPPVNVLTRAVALGVETYLCRKMESALGDICIRRGKL